MLVLAYGPRVAIDESDFSIPPGSVTALIGPNGSGKTTLLSALAGLLRPASGSLEVLGEAAYVLQTTHIDQLLPLTVREAISIGRYARTGMFGRFTQADRVAVDEAMQRLEIEALSGRQLRELSGGQQQRVFVAQGLAQQADLLLLDEPVTGLDLVSRRQIVNAIVNERTAGRTVIFSTHDLGDATLGDQVVLLAGRVVAAGTPGSVLTADHLATAYEHRIVALEAGSFLLDDAPHHDAADDTDRRSGRQSAT